MTWRERFVFVLCGFVIVAFILFGMSAVLRVNKWTSQPSPTLLQSWLHR